MIQNILDLTKKILLFPFFYSDSDYEYQDAMYLAGISSILVFFNIFSLFESIFRNGLSFAILMKYEFQIILFTFIISLTAYVICRTKYFKIGGGITLFIFLFIAWILSLSLNNKPNTLIPLLVIGFILITSIVITGIIYKVKYVLLMLIISLGTIFFTSFFTEMNNQSIIVLLTLFILIIGTLTILHSHTKQKNINRIFEQKEVVEKALSDKINFYSKFSHEFRTPLNIIFGMALLLENALEKDENKGFLTRLRIQTLKMKAMVDNILERGISSTDKVNNKVSEFSLSQILTNIISEINNSYQNKKSANFKNFSSEKSIFYCGNQDLIVEIFYLLIDSLLMNFQSININLRYEKKFEIQISIPLSNEEKEDDLSIIQMIESSFLTGDLSFDKEISSFELNMILVSSLVNKIHGSISSLKNINKFEINLTLPIIQDFNSKPKLTKGYDELKNINILIVDDIEDNIIFLGTLLERKFQGKIGYANDGIQANQKFLHEDYDIILMDIKMPVMDGIEATKLIRSYEKNTGKMNIPIIMITAYDIPEIWEEARLAGCTDIILKPFSPNYLISKITDYSKIEKFY